MSRFCEDCNLVTEVPELHVVKGHKVVDIVMEK